MTVSAAGPAPPGALAAHHLRLFALIVDYLLAFTLAKLAEQAAAGEHWDLAPRSAELGGMSLLGLGLAVALLLVRDAAGGRSPGKWLCGLAVRQARDPAAPASVPQNVLRNVALVLLPVEALLVFVDPYYRRLGDRLAGTVVVQPPRVTHLSRRLLGLAILFLLSLLLMMLVTRWRLHRSAAYETARRIASEHPALQEAVGAHQGFGGEPGLRISPDGDRAAVTLEVEGARGTAEAEVVMHLVTHGERRWELTAVRLLREPEPADGGGMEQAPAPQ